MGHTAEHHDTHTQEERDTERKRTRACARPRERERYTHKEIETHRERYREIEPTKQTNSMFMTMPIGHIGKEAYILYIALTVVQLCVCFWSIQ